MVNLSRALNTAAGGLSAAAAQTAILSRNVANANDPNHTRKSAALASLAHGGALVTGIERSADRALLGRLLETASSSAGTQAYLEGLKRLSETVGDPRDGASIAALLGKLRDDLQLYESDPSKPLNGVAVVRAAGDLAAGLNAASATAQDVRRQADADIAASVTRVNTLLQQFKAANDAAVRGDMTLTGMGEALDARDAALKQLAEEIGIRTVLRGGNDIAIYTDGGVTLFDKLPREVKFAATSVYSATTAGKHVHIDGLPVTDPASGMASRAGRLQGLVTLRDDTAVTSQSQLDGVARGLIQSFAESDPRSPASLPALAGLFMAGGSAALPAAGLEPGLAGALQVNPLADPRHGGNPGLIRDGGFNGPAYRANTTGAASFSGRIARFIDQLGQTRTFDPAGGAGGEASLMSYAATTAGWIEAQRSEATASAARDAAITSRAADALQRQTGVNIDEEMTIMLDLERSYQATSKLIAVVNSMLAALLETV